MQKKILEPNAVCEVCGVAFRGRKGARFCSRSCFDTYRSKKITVTCTNCGKPVAKHPRDVERWMRHFCSMECYSEYKATAEHGGWSDEDRERMRATKAVPEQGTNPNNYKRYLGKRTHRRVAEEMLGRPLRDGEVVHHVNGNKHDNRPENLVVFPSQKEHAAFHAAHPEISGGSIRKKVI